MKQQTFFTTLIAVTLFFCGSITFAKGMNSGFTIAPAIYYATTTVDNGTTSATSTSTLIDFRLGYSMSSLYFGAIYNTYSWASTTTLKHTHMGPSIGYLNGGFNAVFSYLIDIQDERDATNTYKGTGFQLDLGYAFDLGGWAMGPQFTYYSHTYTKNDNGTIETDLTNDYTESGILPKFAFWFTF